jgi:hypothetical protein
MALNTRGVLDPRFPFFARPVVAGAMLCTGTLYRVTPNGEVEWNPFDPDPTKWMPTDVVDLTPIYRGPARVQPGQDWRARQQNARSETLVENIVRVQLAFGANTLPGGVPEGAVPGADLFPSDDLFPVTGESISTDPLVRVDDVFRVDTVHELNGQPVDRQLLTNVLIVRNITTSSNQWVRNLSCALDVTRLIDANEQLVGA